MRPLPLSLFCAALFFCALGQSRAADSAEHHNVLTGKAAFTDAAHESPGIRRHITLADLPAPAPDQAVDNSATVVDRRAGNWPKAPQGFKVELYAGNVAAPRKLLTAPNGDIFVAESMAGQIAIYRGVNAQGKPRQVAVFASGLQQPYGIAFYPNGSDPQWVYIGDTDAVVRFPYRSGDLKARGPGQTLAALPHGGGHWTRDIVFSPDGSKMFVSVGSASNIDDPDTHPAEFHRADVLEFTPAGKFVKVWAWGIRNCAGETINPSTGELWCSVNERDNLGNNLVPDYITHVPEGGFFGWPWWYMGGHQDPRLAGKHPELRSKVLTPDVILQPHFASLGLHFYEGAQFPAEYKGDGFAAEHGSWNRKNRTGYEVIRVPMKNGHATGEFEDFLTGFTNSDGTVWGRPVGVTEGKDGSLFVSDDASGSIWHVIYVGKK